MLILTANRLRRLRRKLSRVRWVARFLPIELPQGKAEKPGVIMIQIDGLGRTELKKALARGRLPFIQGLLKHQHIHLHSYYSGVPSTTPAHQAELFYGVKNAVPAFYFLHRKSRKLFSMQMSQAAKAVVDRLQSETEYPLLKGGHAYADIYTGGAKEARFCAETMNLESLLSRMHPIKWILLPMLYFYKVLRVLALAFFETLLAMVDFFHGILDRKNIWQELKFIPSRIGVVIVLREIVRFMVRLDIERGIPIIHANFLGYDEQAHRRGPESRFAHWTLKGIDGVVRDIVRSARRSDYRDYKVIIYSDHGQEASQNYPTQRGKNVQEAVAQALDDLWNHETVGLVDRRCARVYPTNCLDWKLFGSRKDQPLMEPPDLGEQVTVTAKGPLGHVYLPFTPNEVQKQRAAQVLVQKAGIPLVLYVSGDQVHAHTQKGRFFLPRDARTVIGKNHCFLACAAQDLAATCRHPDAGDLIISGWSPDDPPLSFPVENGSHGGPGKAETHGFVLLPDSMLLPKSRHLNKDRFFLRPMDLRQMVLAYQGAELKFVEPLPTQTNGKDG